MPKGNRYVVLAALGILVGASQPTRGYSTELKKPSSEPFSKQHSTTPFVGVERSPAAVKPDKGCKRGEEDRRSDLCAQWKAADAAYDAARWGLWQLGLSGFALLIGGGTLIAAWMAAFYAKRAATAAEATVDAELRTERVSNEAKFVPMASFSVAGDQAFWSLNAVNSGHTAASAISGKSEIIISKDDTIVWRSKLFIIDFENDSAASGQSIHNVKNFNRDEIMSHLELDSDYVVKISGVLEFNTNFNERHYVKFLYEENRKVSMSVEYGTENNSYNFYSLGMPYAKSAIEIDKNSMKQK